MIHAVGPRGENPDKLRDCYLGSLQRLIDVNQRTIVSIFHLSQGSEKEEKEKFIESFYIN